MTYLLVYLIVGILGIGYSYGVKEENMDTIDIAIHLLCLPIAMIFVLGLKLSGGFDDEL